MEVLAQEAFILIYSQPDALQLTREEQPTDQITVSMQPETVICNGASHPHSDGETNPASGFKTLIGTTTKHDTQLSVEENSRLKYDIENGGSRVESVYPHLQEERGLLPTSLSSSLPHHRFVVDDQPSELGKCRSDDQTSVTEKNSSGYEEQRPVQGTSTHKVFFSHFRPHNDRAIVIVLMGSLNSRMGVSSLTGYGNPWTHQVVLHR
jgi:hypothetical protein